VGAIVAAGGQYGRVSTILGFVAVVCAMTNVTAGFLITDRMLAMFKGQVKKPEARKPEAGRPEPAK
jgi:NAD(P) transhydrogenase subunit alpha